MKNKKTVIILFTFIIMTVCCSCGKNQNESKTNVEYDKLTWNNNTEKYEENSVVFFYKKSADGKYCWITKLDVLDEYKSDKLEFPKEMNGSVLIRIGFDVRDVKKNAPDVRYSVFGSSLSDNFEYPQRFKSIQHIALPDSVQSIEDGTFVGLYSLKTINGPKELKRIGVGAFNDCSGITEFEIGEYVSEIGLGAFRNCGRLGKIHISANNKKYYEQGGFVIDKEQKQAVMAIPGKKELVIPSSVNSFRKNCFEVCKIKRIDLESGENRFIKNGNYIYRKNNKALLLGIVNEKTAIIPESIEELNQDSILIGEDIDRVEMPESLKYLRGAWLDMVDADDCTYVFKSENPPRFVEPSESTSMVPIGQKIFVPKQSFEKYEKWLKKNGGEMNLLKTF